MHARVQRSRVLLLVSALALVSACGGGGGGGSSRADGGGGSGSTNAPPTISGQPASSVRVGQSYSFLPVARDPEGAALSFSIDNLPNWASFEATTGRLSGTPSADALGAHSGIVINVSDGNSSARLGPFSISVVELGNGAATLSWTPPTANTDGSVLQDLAGYRVLYGGSPNELTQTIDINDPSLSSYMVENLTSGTWYFALVAVNRLGSASEPSNLATKTVS